MGEEGVIEICFIRLKSLEDGALVDVFGDTEINGCIFYEVKKSKTYLLLGVTMTSQHGERFFLKTHVDLSIKRKTFARKSFCVSQWFKQNGRTDCNFKIMSQKLEQMLGVVTQLVIHPSRFTIEAAC